MLNFQLSLLTFKWIKCVKKIIGSWSTKLLNKVYYKLSFLKIKKCGFFLTVLVPYCVSLPFLGWKIIITLHAAALIHQAKIMRDLPWKCWNNIQYDSIISMLMFLLFHEWNQMKAWDFKTLFLVTKQNIYTI